MRGIKRETMTVSRHCMLRTVIHKIKAESGWGVKPNCSMETRQLKAHRGDFQDQL